ncbi:hypothetical protein ACR80S_06125 [Halomonas sp. MA07-2]|uniref:hypothetical protein n=1 Tax=Halomonas sp. MA07-2 TaxID=3440841 RepID=UPI003EEB424F
MRGFLWSGIIAAGLAAAGVPAGSSQADDVADMIAVIRAAAERFEDVNVALAEGYVPDPTGECVKAGEHGLPAELGHMGIHYLRPDLLGLTGSEPRVNGTGTHTDFMDPAILLYEPQADGSMVLVGVENLVFAQAWREAGHGEPPSFLGRTWDYMADDPAVPGDQAHGFEPHYDQHVWFRDNPRGNLESFNPAVSCDLRNV